MASVTSLGVGSNLELSTLLDKLATAERAPLDALEKQHGAYQTRLSAYGTVKSMLTAFQATAKALMNKDTFGAVKASVGNGDVLSVTTGANAVPGDLSVNVTRLAQVQSLAGNGFAKQDVQIGSGTLSFEFGTTTGWDEASGTYINPAFTANAATGTAPNPRTVTIDPGKGSLQDIRDAINKAGIGVKASIINDGSATPYRLILTSEKTGETMSMRVTGSSPELQGLAGYDPTTPGANAMKETLRATNAALTVNGIAITSTSNTVVDAAQGVTMTLKKTGTTSMSLTQDSESIKNAVQAMVTAYNNIQSTVKSLSQFDTKAKTKGALNGDSSIRGIQSTLRGVLNTPETGMPAKAPTMLAAIGVSMQKDGTMAIDNKKLDAALKDNLRDVTQLFAGDGTTGGFGRRLSDAVDRMNGETGPIGAVTAGIERSMKDVERRYEAMEVRVNATIERYRKQFTQLDLVVAQMNSTRNYLTQQFQALTNSKK
jgi:flagellar hook-associated protein 2